MHIHINININVYIHGRSDGRTGGRSVKQSDGRMVRRTVGQTESRTDAGLDSENGSVAIQKKRRGKWFPETDSKTYFNDYLDFLFFCNVK